MSLKYELDPEVIKQDFPIFKRRVYGKRLIYLDHTKATSGHGSYAGVLRKLQRQCTQRRL